jgi:hypothetical protein
VDLEVAAFGELGLEAFAGLRARATQELVLSVEAVDDAPATRRGDHRGSAGRDLRLIGARALRPGAARDPRQDAMAGVQSACDREPKGGVIRLPVTCARMGITEPSSSRSTVGAPVGRLL